MSAKVHKLPTVQPTELCASLAQHKDVAGAFVIVLGRDGSLDMGLAVDDNPEVNAPLMAIANVVREHCDKNHEIQEDAPPSTETDPTSAN
jgi:hypothetical protein